MKRSDIFDVIDERPDKPAHHRWFVLCALLLFGVTAPGCASLGQAGTAKQDDALDEATQGCKCDKEPSTPDARAQAADEPQAIISEQVSFRSKGAELAGVIDRPQDVNEPLAAVVILHDSGPMDRRGLFGGSLGLELPVEVAVYEELAENLAQNGYLVLRFDKRTCVEGGPPWCSYPRDYIEDHREELVGALLADANAAVDTLRKRADVDPSRIFLLGHGQGAEIALALAKRVAASGLVLLAPSPYPLDKVVLHQTEASLAHLKKRRAAEGNTTMGTLLQEQLDALEISYKEQQEAFEKLRADEREQSDLEQGDVLGAPKKTWTGLFELHEQAMEGLTKTRVPLIALFGEHDLNLPEDSAERFQNRLGPSPDAEVMSLPGLTHPMVAVDDEEDGGTTQVSQDVHQAILHFFEQLGTPASSSPGS